MARTRITGQLRLFLDVLYVKYKGVAADAAAEAGYPNPILDGPRLRRKYPDLCERSRLAWIERAHVGYDQALELLGKVALDSNHKDQVRALNIVLELNGARSKQDPAALRRELTTLLQQLAIKRGAGVLAAPQQVLDTVPVQPAVSQRPSTDSASSHPSMGSATAREQDEALRPGEPKDGG